MLKVLLSTKQTNFTHTLLVIPNF